MEYLHKKQTKKKVFGIDDDKPIIIEGEYALAVMEELRDAYGLNEEQQKR